MTEDELMKRHMTNTEWYTQSLEVRKRINAMIPENNKQSIAEAVLSRVPHTQLTAALHKASVDYLMTLLHEGSPQAGGTAGETSETRKAEPDCGYFDVSPDLLIHITSLATSGGNVRWIEAEDDALPTGATVRRAYHVPHLNVVRIELEGAPARRFNPKVRMHERPKSEIVD